MLPCPPCCDYIATDTGVIASIHVFNDFHRNVSDIKGLHVKVKKVGTAWCVWGKTALSERGKTAPGPCCPAMQYEYDMRTQ